MYEKPLIQVGTLAAHTYLNMCPVPLESLSINPPFALSSSCSDLSSFSSSCLINDSYNYQLPQGHTHPLLDGIIPHDSPGQ